MHVHECLNPQKYSKRKKHEGQEENPGKLTETLPLQKFTTLLASINLQLYFALSKLRAANL